VPEEQVVLWGRPAGIASKYLSGKKQFHLDRRGIEDWTLEKSRRILHLEVLQGLRVVHYPRTLFTHPESHLPLLHIKGL